LKAQKRSTVGQQTGAAALGHNRGLTQENGHGHLAIDVYVIRANLESLATYLAVKRNDPHLIGVLRELHEKMVQVAKKGDRKTYYRLNGEFHSAVIHACENEQLIDMLDMFGKHTARYRSEVLSIPGKLDDSVKKHSVLIRSIELGDAERAEALRKESILENIALLQQHYDNRGHHED
jgi:DNA-binding GntR family transcriptional regulator